MRLSVLCAIAILVTSLPLCAQDTATVRAADGFELPVGPNGTGDGYYIARGYRPNGHLGEDWNGVHGGDTDLGDPVYATANGYVMFARNYHVGWGNVVILRHAYYEGSTLKYVDSLYGHLLEFFVQEGEQVKRGQKIARIGNNFGMYEAHLHFEMRKNLQIGMFRSSFARDFSNYYTPNEFVAAHRACPNGNHMVSIPINTYPAVPPPIIAGPHVETPVFGPPPAGAPNRFAKVSPLPPLAPAPTPPPTPAIKLITKVATPTPAPATPEPKIAKVTVPPSTPAPASTTKHAKATAATSTPEPTSKTARSSNTETAAATEPSTPAPSSKRSKSTAAAATPTPAGKSSKKSTTSTSVAAASTPSPAKKGTKTPAPITAATTPTPAPVAASKTRKAPTASPTPQPAVATTSDSATILSDPLLPVPTTKEVAPIRRAGSGYKVDRFEDLRGKPGY
ncbi:MAG: peptidoglycan DD-metalloendopeptidase family protein [Chthoniobacter sp.]|nr:peptidoglycan DD-metalloendopeptidase family protein [Chthoniobacter sp.]